MARQVVPSVKPDVVQPVNIERLGQFVRFQRTSIGMTIEDAAALCGISKQAFSNVESGLETVKVNTLFKILDNLGIKLWFNQNEIEGDDEWL